MTIERNEEIRKNLDAGELYVGMRRKKNRK